MSPVHDAASFVPFVLPAELDRVPLGERYPLGDIYVVTEQQGVIGLQTDDEPLVSRAFQIIGKYLFHGPGRFHHDSRTPSSEGVENRLISIVN